MRTTWVDQRTATAAIPVRLVSSTKGFGADAVDGWRRTRPGGVGVYPSSMAAVEDGLDMEDPQAEAVSRERPRRVTAGIAVLSLVVGIVIGSAATLALAPTSSSVVSTGAEGPTASTLQDLVEVDAHPPGMPEPGQSSTDSTRLAPVETSTPPPPTQDSSGQLPPARQRFVATLEAEPGWAPTDHFAGTITVVQYVPKGAKLMSGDLGEGSGRIWAHGPIRPA